MKTLEEHNKEAAQRIKLKNSYPRKNGIACPKCNQEMSDTDAMVLLLSYPPQKNVSCESCGHRDYRIC